MMWTAFPTWALYRITPLPQSHPWYRRRFTLRDWWMARTDLCKEFDAVFWIILVTTPLALYLLLAGQ